MQFADGMPFAGKGSLRSILRERVAIAGPKYLGEQQPVGHFIIAVMLAQLTEHGSCGPANKSATIMHYQVSKWERSPLGKFYQQQRLLSKKPDERDNDVLPRLVHVATLSSRPGTPVELAGKDRQSEKVRNSDWQLNW